MFDYQRGRGLGLGRLGELGFIYVYIYILWITKNPSLSYETYIKIIVQFHSQPCSNGTSNKLDMSWSRRLDMIWVGGEWAIPAIQVLTLYWDIKKQGTQPKNDDEPLDSDENWMLQIIWANLPRKGAEFLGIPD